MVLVKSFLAATKWTMVFFIIIFILFGLGGKFVSIAVLSPIGFVIMFIMFLLENLELRY